MVDSANQSARSLKPLLLHLQKLGLELKCPLCLELLKRPLLLPCDHIFCKACTPKTAHCGSECPLCQAQYHDRDLRPLPFVESIIAIYKNLEAANRFQSVSSDNKVPVDHSVENGIPQNTAAGKSGITDKECEMFCSGGDRCTVAVEQDANCVIVGSKITARAVTTQVDHLTPGSPPSFGDVKDSENGSCQSPQNCEAEKSVKRNADDMKRHESSASETEKGYTGNSKRHKKLNYGHLGKCPSSTDHVKPNNSQTEKLENFPSQVGQKSMVPDSDATLESLMKTVCGFCQSSRVSEDTGSMLHYINGKSVKETEATLPNAVHVHSLCIEWAPQVYYDGETVKNLNAELARGAKLKCTKCGLKGAALGCYVKSCRKSYHAPCAMGISKCRWDYENFLLLCPAHSSAKFPKEKSRRKKQQIQNCPRPTLIVPQQSSFWAGSSDGAKEWVFCGSALSSEDKCLLVNFGSMIGVNVTKLWKPNVTHVIAATDAQGACTRTLKVLMAILNGRWVITIDWIKACMQSMHPVDEEPYEVSIDNHGSRDGPKTGRLRALENAQKLFSGYNFHLVGHFLPGYKEDLENLVVAAGGTIWRSEEELGLQSHEQADLSRTLIVYNLDPPEGCKLGDEVSIIWQRANEAGDLASKIGCQVVGHTWLLESIAAYKLLPVVS